jgi:hypothetical protein
MGKRPHAETDAAVPAAIVTAVDLGTYAAFKTEPKIVVFAFSIDAKARSSGARENPKIATTSFKARRTVCSSFSSRSDAPVGLETLRRWRAALWRRAWQLEFHRTARAPRHAKLARLDIKVHNLGYAHAVTKSCGNDAASARPGDVVEVIRKHVIRHAFHDCSVYMGEANQPPLPKAALHCSCPRFVAFASKPDGPG